MHKLMVNGLEVKTFTFSGGEVNPRIPSGVKAPFTVTARLQSSDDIMNLLMLHSAIMRQYPFGTVVDLVVPYLPYARQDRVCSPGEALGLEVMICLLERFTSLTVTDVHNEEALSGRNFKNLSISHIMKSSNFPLKDYVLVSPDAGAFHKVDELTLDTIIEGSKIRDPNTGALSGFGFSSDYSHHGKDLLIVDDICDGGGTFIGLAEKLKELNPTSMSLYVTHGIFSKGVDDLLKVFDRIYTTDSFISPYMDHERVTILKG